METRKISFLNLVSVVDGRAVPGMSLQLMIDMCSHLMGRELGALEAEHVRKCIQTGVVRPMWAEYVAETWVRTLASAKGDFLLACEIAACYTPHSYDVFNLTREQVRKIDATPPFELPPPAEVTRWQRVKAAVRRALKYIAL